MASPYFETAFVWLCLLMTVDSGFGMVGRDRFAFSFRTVNQADSELKTSAKQAKNEQYSSDQLTGDSAAAHRASSYTNDWISPGVEAP